MVMFSTLHNTTWFSKQKPRGTDVTLPIIPCDMGSTNQRLVLSGRISLQFFIQFSINKFQGRLYVTQTTEHGIGNRNKSGHEEEIGGISNQEKHG